MDINLPGMNGVECVRQLKQVLPHTQMVMLTVYEDTENIFKALAAGASGYLLKRTRSAELLDAIREVHQGRIPHDHPHCAQSCAVLSEDRTLAPGRRRIFLNGNSRCSTA